jgi:L-amino acid N-acyltransferase YncA
MLEEEYETSRRVLPQHLRPAPAPEPEFTYELRDAVEADIPNIREIYNHYVLNSTVTFDEKAATLAQMRVKFAKAKRLGMPWVVAEAPSGQIIGTAWVLPWQDKAAYRFTVEDSIYLGPAAQGRGLGRALLSRLIERSREEGLKEMISLIADKGADASIALHKKLGFKEVGHMGKVGYKFDRWLGTVMLQKNLRKKDVARKA